MDDQTYFSQLNAPSSFPFKPSKDVMLGQTLFISCVAKDVLQMCTEGSNICSLDLSCPSNYVIDPTVNCLCPVWQALLLQRQKAAQVQMPGASLCLALARLTPPFPCKYFH